MPDENKTISKSETGHAKFLESLDRLIAADATLDPARLNAPANLRSAALAALRTEAGTRHAQVGDSKAYWRTVTLDRQTDADKLDSMAAQAVALLDSRGAKAETVEDARSYVRKLHGASRKKRSADDPATPDTDESAKGISVSQQSNAAKISTFYELIDFLEAQPEYAGVTNAGFKIADLRTFADALQSKHQLSITAATTLAADRNARNDYFYDSADSVLNTAKRYKKLVYGEYGAKSPEYQLVNHIPFQKPSR